MTRRARYIWLALFGLIGAILALGAWDSSPGHHPIDKEDVLPNRNLSAKLTCRKARSHLRELRVAVCCFGETRSHIKKPSKVVRESGL
jgi:hypothetical protein